MILKMTELLRKNRPDFDKAREAAKAYNAEEWEKEIERIYGASASTIIALERKSQKNAPAGRLARIDMIEKNWDEIVKIMNDNLPSSVHMIEILKSMDAPFLPAQIGFDDERLYNALLYAKETRERYSLLSMMADLGVTKDLAKQVVAFVQEQN